MIYVARENLLAALGTAQKAIGKSQLPILENVLIAPSAGSLRLTASDLETEISTSCYAEDTDAGDIFTVSAKKLAGICKALPKDVVVKINQVENEVQVSTGKSRFNIATLPAQDFPSMDQAAITGSFAIEAATLKRMMVNADSTMGITDARYYLNGMLLHIVGGILYVVATDGHRLGMSEISMATEPSDCKHILPRKYAQTLLRELPSSEDSIRMEFGDGFCRAQWHDKVICGKLLMGNYPDYQRVIPYSSPKSALVNSDALCDMLTRAAAIRNDKYFGVKLTFTNNTLAAEAASGSKETFSDEIAIEYIGEETCIGFNADYLLTALASLKCANIALEFNGHMDSILLRDPEDASKLHVVMPMRL